MTPAELTLYLVCLSVLLLIVLAVLTALLVRRGRGPAGQQTQLIEQSLRETRADIEKLGRAAAAGDAALRTEVTAAVNAVGDKTETLTRGNYEMQLRLTESLARMQEKLSAADKESAAAVAAAVEKLQQSNEKKLDEMRAMVNEKLTGTLNERLDASFQTVSEQLAKVHRSLGEMQEMSGGISALNRVLAGVKTRGN